MGKSSWRNKIGSVGKTIKPEHQIYLLVHVVLFIGGLLLAQVGGPTWLAIGTSVAATGVCGWVIYFWVRLNEQGAHRAQNIQRLGVIDAFAARSVPIRPEYERRFFAARQQIDFLGFGLRALREDFGNDMDAWLQRVPLRFLLVDPQRPVREWTYAAQRDLEEGNSDGSIATDVVSFLRFMTPLKNRFPNRLHIRLYSCLPAINVCRIDDEMFWGPYIVGEQSRNTPTFLVARNGTLFDVLRSHYEQIWSDPRFSRDGFAKSSDQFRSVVENIAIKGST